MVPEKEISDCLIVLEWIVTSSLISEASAAPTITTTFLQRCNSALAFRMLVGGRDEGRGLPVGDSFLNETRSCEGVSASTQFSDEGITTEGQLEDKQPFENDLFEHFKVIEDIIEALHEIEEGLRDSNSGDSYCIENCRTWANALSIRLRLYQMKCVIDLISHPLCSNPAARGFVYSCISRSILFVEEGRQRKGDRRGRDAISPEKRKCQNEVPASAEPPDGELLGSDITNDAHFLTWEKLLVILANKTLFEWMFSSNASSGLVTDMQAFEILQANESVPKAYILGDTGKDLTMLCRAMKNLLLPQLQLCYIGICNRFLETPVETHSIVDNLQKFEWIPTTWRTEGKGSAGNTACQWTGQGIKECSNAPFDGFVDESNLSEMMRIFTQICNYCGTILPQPHLSKLSSIPQEYTVDNNESYVKPRGLNLVEADEPGAEDMTTLTIDSRSAIGNSQGAIQKTLSLLQTCGFITSEDTKRQLDSIQLELSNGEMEEAVNIHPAHSVMWDALWTIFDAMDALRKATALKKSQRWRRSYPTLNKHRTTTNKRGGTTFSETVEASDLSPLISVSESDMNDRDISPEKFCEFVDTNGLIVDKRPSSLPEMSEGAHNDSASKAFMFKRLRLVRTDGEPLMAKNPTARRLSWTDDVTVDGDDQIVGISDSVMNASSTLDAAQPGVIGPSRRWSSQQVMELIDLVNRYGSGNWALMKENSQYIQTKSSSQLKDKWRNLNVYQQVKKKGSRYVVASRET